MKGFLLDTNCVSESMRIRPDQRVSEWFKQTESDQMYISVLTLGEIRRGIVTLTHGRKRTQLETWLQTILRPSFAGRILDVNGEIADRWGILDAEAKQNGRSVPSIDGLLAATALEHNLTLVTRNTRDFEHTLISVFNPWTS